MNQADNLEVVPIPWPKTDYARLDYHWKQHHERYKRYVEREGLCCQACGGAGGQVDVIIDGTGPWEPCGYCEGTGLVTPWMRGLWLRWKREGVI